MSPLFHCYELSLKKPSLVFIGAGPNHRGRRGSAACDVARRINEGVLKALWKKPDRKGVSGEAPLACGTGGIAGSFGAHLKRSRHVNRTTPADIGSRELELSATQSQNEFHNECVKIFHYGWRITIGSVDRSAVDLSESTALAWQFHKWLKRSTVVGMQSIKGGGNAVLHFYLVLATIHPDLLSQLPCD